MKRLVIGILAHVDSGKTTLSEAMLYTAGALRKLGGRLVENRTFTLPDGSARCLIVCEKVSPTPAAYPRNGGKIAKKPL